MDLYEKILSMLKEEYENGATYQEMAKKYGLSYSYLRELLLGIKPVSRMSLDFFFKLFPAATISVEGKTIVPVVNNGTNSGAMTGVIQYGDNADKVLNQILSTEDLTAEEKIKVIKVLKK